MASSSSSPLKPPKPVDFATTEAWPRWIKRVERYRVASGLDKKEDLIQVSTLIYAMRQDAEDVLGNFTLSEDKKGKYKVSSRAFKTISGDGRTLSTSERGLV